MWESAPAHAIRKHSLQGILGCVSLGRVFLNMWLAALKLIYDLSLTYNKITAGN